MPNSKFWLLSCCHILTFSLRETFCILLDGCQGVTGKRDRHTKLIQLFFMNRCWKAKQEVNIFSILSLYWKFFLYFQLVVKRCKASNLKVPFSFCFNNIPGWGRVLGEGGGVDGGGVPQQGGGLGPLPRQARGGGKLLQCRGLSRGGGQWHLHLSHLHREY